MSAERLSSIVAPDNQERRLVVAEQIPQELVVYPQWVCWRYVDRGKDRKPDKQPVNPRNLANAGVHWANTWTSFDEAYTTYRHYCHRQVQGIGFVMTPTDPYVAVDLDNCLHEDEMESTAAHIVHTLGSYTEISPSGRGLRVLLACPEFQSNTRRAGMEIYAHSRYVTVTGHHLATTPSTISAVTPDLLASLLPPVPEHGSSPPAQSSGPAPYPAGDRELWERIFTHDKYGHQHLQRFQGDNSLDRGDHSFTVIRLLNCLARWTHSDPIRMRSMILLSPLANEKWFEKRGGGDWLDYQIADAIAYISGRKGK